MSTELYMVSYSGDGKHIAVSGKEDGSSDSLAVYAVDQRSLQLVGDAPRSFPHQINAIAWAPDCRHVVLAATGVVEIVLGSTLETVHSFDAHNANCYAVKFSSDGSLFAVGSGDSLVSVWDTESLSCIGSLSANPTLVRSVSWHGSGDLIAWCCESKTVDIGRPGESRSIAQAAAEADVNCVAWHPTASILAAACDKPATAPRTHSEAAGAAAGVVQFFTFREAP